MKAIKAVVKGIVCLAAALTFGQLRAAENLVVNGDFESGGWTGTAFAENVSDALLPGWTAGKHPRAGLSRAQGTFVSSALKNVNDSVYLFLKYGLSSIEQEIAIPKAGLYRLEFDHTIRPSQYSQVNTVYFAGQSVFSWVDETDVSKELTHESVDIPILTPGTYTLKFEMDATKCANTDKATVYDNISLTYQGAVAGVKISGQPKAAGAPSPAYGFVPATAGESVSCSAPGRVDVDNDNRYELKGWEIYEDGVKTAAGTDREISVTAGENVELVWLWTPIYRVCAAAAEGGTVEPDEQWVAEGEETVITAMQTGDDEFSGWVGDGLTDAQRQENPLVVVVTGPLSLTARFGFKVGDWTAGVWTTAPAPGAPSFTSRNVLKGLTPTTSTDWETTENGYNADAGVLADGIAATSPYCGIKSNASITYDLSEPKDISEFRIWAACGGTAHNGLHIADITVSHSDGSVEKVENSAVDDESGNGCYAILRNAKKSALVTDVTKVTFNFGAQKNGWCGYCELEAVEAFNPGTGANLVSNGDFEAGEWTGTDFVQTANDTQMPGWKPRTAAGLTKASGVFLGKGHALVNNTTWGMLKYASPCACMEQKVTVDMPGVYRLSFDTTTRPNYCGQTNYVLFNGNVVYERTITADDKSGYVVETAVVDVPVEETGTFTLRFEMRAPGDTSSIFDNIQFRLLKGVPSLTVVGSPDEAGEVDPAYGSQLYEEGVVVTCTAPIAVEEPDADSRYELDGWELFRDGASVGTGIENGVDVTIEGAMTLVWKWNSTYKVTAEASVGGSVEPEEQWISMGEPATVTAKADDGAAFMGWTGEGLMPEQQESNPLTFTVTGAKAVKANFGASVELKPDGTGAYATLGEAVAAMSEAGSGVIRLAPGAYPVSDVVKVLAPLTIESTTGKPDDVTVYADDESGIHSVFMVSNTLAIVRGLTIAGGSVSARDAANTELPYAPELLGGNVSLFAGQVRNCRITGGEVVGDFSGSFKVGAAGVAVCGGSLVDCDVFCNTNRGGTYVTAASGVWVNGADALVANCTIRDNFTDQTYAQGGGLQLNAGTVIDTAITRNVCYGTGAGAYMTGGRLEGCLIARNQLVSVVNSRASGLHTNPSGEMYIVNCTVADNSGYHGGGIYVQNYNAQFVNCISYGNTEVGADYNNGRPNVFNIQPASVQNCCFFGTPLGSSSVNADPCFVDAANGDYRLAACSPCIGAGAKGADIGCCAYGMPAVTIATATTFPAQIGTTLSFTLAVRNMEGKPTCTWTVDNLTTGEKGVASGGDSVASFAPNAAGRYALTATATAGLSVSGCYEFTVGAADVYLAPAGASEPKEPYASPETAANDVNKALLFAADGTTVHVAAGDYDVGDEVIVAKAVRIEAEDGPEVTSFYRAGAYRGGERRRVLHCESAGAEIVGLTVTNGYRLAGYDLSLRNATATNCRIGGGMGDAACLVTTGRIVDSTLFNCRATDGRDLGVALGLIASGATAEGCTFCGTRQENDYYSGSTVLALAGAHVNRCVFTDNNTRGFRSGALEIKGANVVVENSLFYGNINTYNTTGSAAITFGMDGASVIRNCTFAKNTGSDAGAIDFNDKKGMTVMNCIFQEEKADFARAKTGEMTWGKNWFTTDGDAKFKSVANNNFHLRGGSPCINAGDLYDGASATDLDGNPRVKDGQIDLGCYQKAASGFLLHVR